MDERTRSTATLLLRQLEDGDDGAEEQLFELVYADLHRQAERCLVGQPASQTLQSTDLVHEVYAKLFVGEVGKWENRRHFLGVAAKAMRSILVDHARARHRAKRSPPGERVALDSLVARFEERTLDVLALEAALCQLAEEDTRAARVVELRLFAGLSVSEVAGVLQLPKRTIERDWTFARIRLRRLIG
ncbi:MAG: ECF-type sigma factor [Planctomycetota bacterium]|nr:ECF-type sigma factor [Planctomycetota bacterium]